MESKSLVIIALDRTLIKLEINVRARQIIESKEEEILKKYFKIVRHKTTIFLLHLFEHQLNLLNHNLIVSLYLIRTISVIIRTSRFLPSTLDKKVAKKPSKNEKFLRCLTFSLKARLKLLTNLQKTISIYNTFVRWILLRFNKKKGMI